MAHPASKPVQDYPIKLTIERSVLLKSLARLQSIVEKRNTIPILANVKLDAREGELQLTATDMDLVATETIPADVQMQGALTIPAQTLHDIVRKMQDGTQVVLDTDVASAQVLVSAGKAQFKISYLPADDFPVMSEGVFTHHFVLPVTQCITLIEKCRFAMSSEETRYYLNGVYLHVASSKSGEQMLKTVATDGHRLARIESVMPEGAAGMPGVIIPRKTVTELRKILDEQGLDVEIAVSENKIRFSAGKVVLLSKLVDGTFPDYQRVIPESNNKVMEVNVKALSTAVDRVATIATDKTRGVRVSLEAGKITLNAQNADAGFAEEELEVSYDSDPLEIGFNSRYMLEMLGQLEGDTVQFVFADANAPALVNDPADVMSLYVIMPMRV